MAMKPAARAVPSALDKALTLANQSALSKGELPPSTCHQQSATTVTCSNPVLPISAAAFRTYPSLAALYSAYVAKIQSIAPGPLRVNYGNCNTNAPSGEVSWNHRFLHSTAYSMRNRVRECSTPKRRLPDEYSAISIALARNP